ncbi:IS4/IS5 family transposase [Streptococcus mutans]|uniref:transposase n=2 Tax=Streptococcus mutans TaxID=1309 RepID=UPI0002B4F567|nr:transposase [Streptococcus mutans]EMB87849.1 putative transposase [Streptococcus mutans NMT4863]MCB5062908.1 transposase [Streptococcus mutans]MDB8631197.1 transposase [Streptococcus mutans]NLQ87575.1 IS4/IS5 family transposase [Streptococcus mutans]
MIPLLKLIHQGMTEPFHQDDMVIRDSFPIPVVYQLATTRFVVLGIKQLWPTILQKRCGFTALKPICWLVTLSGFIVNYGVTPASVHDRQVAKDLLENTTFPVVLADLGYLSKVLKQHLTQKGYCFWTPYLNPFD